MAMSQPRPPDICYLCLTNDRITFRVSQNKKAVFSFVTSYHYHIQFMEARVCWECKALLEKFQKFKERAELATRALEKARRITEPVVLISLSNLEKTRLVVIDILTYTGGNESALKNIPNLPKCPLFTIPNNNKQQENKIIYIGGKKSATKNIQSLPKHPMHTVSNKIKEQDKKYNEDQTVINIDDDDDIECVPVKTVDNDKLRSKQNKNNLQHEENCKNDGIVINIEADIAMKPETISGSCVDKASDDDNLSSDNSNESDDSKSNNREVDNFNDGNSDIEYVGLSSDSETKNDTIDKTTTPMDILFVDAPGERQENEQIKTAYINLTDCENGTESTQNTMYVTEETSSTTIPMLVLNEPMIPVLLSEDKKTLTYVVVDTPPQTNEVIMSQTAKDIVKKDKSKLRTIRIKQSPDYKQREKALKMNPKVMDKQKANASNKNNIQISNKLEYQQPENCLIAIEDSITEGRCERFRGTLADVLKIRESYRSIRTGTPVCVQCVEAFCTPEALFQHISTRHFQEGEFMCDICSCRFSDKYTLATHLDAHYAMIRCKAINCMYVDTCVVRMHRHVYTAHADPKSFVRTTECNFCGGVFKSRQYFLIHMKKHTNTHKYICDYCQKQYDTRTQLSCHISKLHLRLGAAQPRQICETCGKSVKKYSSHLRVHGIFRCNQCKIDFNSKDDLLKHNSVHFYGKYKCDICQEKFDYLTQKEKHVKRHKDRYPYKCTSCNACYSDKYKLTEHSYKHIPNKEHVCFLCNKRFMFKSKLSIHMKSHSNDDGSTRFPAVLSCDLCPKKFRRIQSLITHREIHTSQQRYQCHYCSQVFQTRPEICLHMHYHSFKVRCDVCGKEFQHERYLKFHALLHLEPSQRQLQIEKVDETNPNNRTCNVCGKIFLTYESLHSHYGFHMRKLPLKCTVCDRTFKFQSQLYRHMMRHSGDRPFKCNVCGARFVYKTILNNHLNSHSDYKQYKCGECDMSFKYSSGLWEHKKMHKGEKPYQCSVCGLRFRVKGNFSGHMKIHTNERPHECNVCGKKFPWQSHLRSHYKTHLKIGLEWGIA